MARRPRRLPRPKSRRPLERRYTEDLRTLIVAPAVAIVRAHVLPRVRRFDGSALRVDQEDDLDPADLVAEARRAYEGAVPSGRRTRIAAGHLGRVEQAQGAEFDRVLVAAVAPGAGSPRRAAAQVRGLMGIDPIGRERWLEPVMRSALRDNVALIKDLPADYYGRLEEDLAAWVRGGLRPEEMATRIAERYLTDGDTPLGVVRRRAELIAVDQVGKFHGALDEARQKDLGAEEYIWRTSVDERVRAEHAEREGRVFRWDSPPPDGHPGQPIRCRCYAEPRIPGLEDLLAA